MKRVLSVIVFFSMVLMLFGCATVNEAWKEPAVISSSELKKSGAKKDITSMDELAESIMNLADDSLFDIDGEFLSEKYRDFILDNVIGKDLLKKLEKAKEELEEKGTASLDYSKGKKVLYKDKEIKITDFYEELKGNADIGKKYVDCGFKLKFTESIDPKKFEKNSNIKDLLCKLKFTGSINLLEKDKNIEGKMDVYLSLVLAASFVDPKTERGGILTVSSLINIDLTHEDLNNISSKKYLDEDEDEDEETLYEEIKELYDFFKPELIIEVTNDDGVSTFRRECRTLEDFKKIGDELDELDEKFDEIKEAKLSADSSI
ncbi:MAG: hypothetical protein K6B17_03375 [Treponema sp.]|nr:hypothetical protein [Treponema sp.]